jgi:di/tricarboxylate transporter
VSIGAYNVWNEKIQAAMTVDSILILIILVGTVALFFWGRWRHDVVALAALLACVLTGLVPGEAAFVGFGHPAVITVACVLILSRGLQNTGAIDSLTRVVLPRTAGPAWSMTGLIGLGALLSAFMNNVGAMALLMPIALQMAARHKLTPGQVLMPLSFGTILGGMTTLIGTPPNLIVSGFRAESAGGFDMFDFTPVGLAVAGSGVVFLILLGWRLVPTRPGVQAGHFETGKYLAEARITDSSKAAGLTLSEAEGILEAADGQIVGLLRKGTRIGVQNRRWVLHAEDILVIEAEPESLSAALTSLGLVLDAPQEVSPAESETDKTKPVSEETALQEFVSLPQARLIGRSMESIKLRTRYGLSLLALSRQGRRIVKRLRFASIRAGDVLLLQGTAEALAEFAGDYGCVPLATRSISIPNKRRAITAGLVMVAAISLSGLGLMPANIAFAAAVLLYIVLGVISTREVYSVVDWSIVVLLGALIPVAHAMSTTGTADWMARGMLDTLARGHPVVALALVLIVTMTLSDFMNNAATAAMMCPIAFSTSTFLDVRPDAFLMAVAIGASCAFLTPIGHQNNTLILGPGGFRFSDYWRLGLPMEILVVAVGVPVLLHVWPL